MLDFISNSLSVLDIHTPLVSYITTFSIFHFHAPARRTCLLQHQPQFSRTSAGKQMPNFHLVSMQLLIEEIDRATFTSSYIDSPKSSRNFSDSTQLGVFA
jgi:hypothetical protein